MKITQTKNQVILEFTKKTYVIPKKLTEKEVKVQVYLSGVLKKEEGNNSNNTIAFFI